MTTSSRSLLALGLLLAPYLVAAALALAVVLALVSGNLVATVVAVVAAVVFAVAVRPAFRRSGGSANGVEVGRTTQPRLWAEVDKLATAAGTAVPAELWLVPDARVLLWEDTGLLGLRRGPQRLTIGLPLLSGLTVQQFQALTGHELGRYRGRLSGTVYRGADALDSLATGTLWRRFAGLYGAVAGDVIGDQVLDADELAVRLAGRNPARAALRESVALDRAWRTFRERYGDLGADHGRRPLAVFDGFQRFLAEPTRQLQLIEVRNGLTVDDRRPGQPPLRDRLAAIDELPDDGAVDDYTPALTLLNDPDKLLRNVEAWMYAGTGLKPTGWDELASSAGAEDARTGARMLTVAAEESGLAKPATLTTVFDAVRRGELSAIAAPLLESDATVTERLRMAERLLTDLVVIALIDAGRASYRLNWAGPSALVGPDGAPLDLGPVVAHAIDDPTAAYALQGWLTACGVRPDYRVDTDGEPQPAEAGESHESAHR